ncbi:MAG TPA: MFS transporter [Candidatus Dormibacteraeota bacterium]|nr:MFS transporter [Candidatus Dormibacteraeota bacterium]
MTGSENRWWLVVGAGLAVFMVALDASIVNVALPTIGRDFRSPAAVTQWTILGYLLPAVALVLPAGRWLDLNGRRPAFVLAIAGFAASSAAAGAAPGIGWLIVARVAQGVFAALLGALIPALVTGAVQPQVRARAMSVVATLGPLGAVTGPAVGGFLIAAAGWPWIFYVNVPVSVGVITIGLRTLEPGGGLRLPRRSWLVESSLLAAAGTALLVALTQASVRGIGWLLAAAIALPLIAIWSRLPSSRPVVDLVRAPGMVSPLAALLVNVTAIAGTGFIAPFYLQQALHASSAVTGLTVIAMPIGMAVTSQFGGYVADRWGARQTTAVGTLVIATGLGLIAPLSGSWHPVDLGWRLAVVGIGLGLFAGPNMAVAMQQAPRHLLATGGAATSLARSLAFALGPVLVTIPWALAAYSEGGMRRAAILSASLAVLGAGVRAVSVVRGRDAVVADSAIEAEREVA